MRNSSVGGYEVLKTGKSNHWNNMQRMWYGVL